MDRSRSGKAFAGAVALLVVAAGCGGGGGDSAPKAKVSESVDVTPGAVTVSSAGAQVGLDDTVRDQMLDTVKQYVQAATVDPLKTGRNATRLAPLFTARAAARAAGADRAVLVDEGIPVATAGITAKAVPVAITVLVDQTGSFVLASASLDLTATTKTADGPVEIHRTGSLTLAPDAGVWKVGGFDLAVARSGKGVDAALQVAGTTNPSGKDAP